MLKRVLMSSGNGALQGQEAEGGERCRHSADGRCDNQAGSVFTLQYPLAWSTGGLNKRLPKMDGANTEFGQPMERPADGEHRA